MNYFTFLPVHDEDMPWAEQEDWPKVALPELQEASDEWLKVVGLR